MSCFIVIDPETELKAEPYGYEYRCYMFEDHPILQTMTTNVYEVIENLEIQDIQNSSRTEPNQNFLINKIEELIDQQKNDKFCVNILHQLQKGHLVPEKPYFV